MLYQDLRGAFKYDIRTFQPADLDGLTIAGHDRTGSSRYEAVNYYILEKLLSQFCAHSDCRSIVDLGCGKGRVMAVAAHYGFQRITGVEFAVELCEEAHRNLRRTEQKVPCFKWNIFRGHVLHYHIRQDDSVFFLFNPFDGNTLSSFLSRLDESCQRFQRTTYFLYANPEYGRVLEARGYKLIYEVEVLNLQGAIFERPV